VALVQKTLQEDKNEFGHSTFQRWATATLLKASLLLPLFAKFNSGATAAVPE